MKKYKYQVGEKVVYQELVGIVDYINDHGDYETSYGLTSELDPEMTCTARESEIEPYREVEDQEKTLRDIRTNTNIMLAQLDRMTDKYIGDCSF